MTENFIIAHNKTAEFEGGFNEIREDRGGATNFGISLNFLKTLGTQGDINKDGAVDRDDILYLTKEQAEELFYKHFWLPYKLDEVPLPVAFCVYDMAVNHGTRGMSLIVQRSFNDYVGDYSLIVDGVYGNRTRLSISEANNESFIKSLSAERKAYYDSIIHNRPEQVVFQRGWYNRANAMRDYATELLNKKQG